VPVVVGWGGGGGGGGGGVGWGGGVFLLGFDLRGCSGRPLPRIFERATGLGASTRFAVGGGATVPLPPLGYE
jgi:hypothetical protein